MILVRIRSLSRSSFAKRYRFQVFEDVMKEIHENDGNNFVEWQNINVISSSYFIYSWGSTSCERITRTKGANELLEMVKHKQFDVIVQDVTLDQCLYGLWEVNEIFLYICIYILCA